MKKPLVLVVLFLGFAALHASAQNLRKVLPQTPSKKGEEAPLAEPAPQKSEGGSEVLIKQLRGVRFVAGPAIVPSGVKPFTGIEAEGLPFLQQPEFTARIAREFLGKPVSLDTLSLLTRATGEQYRRNDRTLVTVLVPEQDVTGNVLQIAVIEGHVHAVKSEGNRWFSSDLFLARVGLQPGDPVSQSRLAGNISRLNRNPFHSTTVELVAGPEVGTTDFVLKTRDRFPARFYTGYDNSGNAVTGQDRYNFGFNYGNLFGLDQQVNYQFTSDNAFELYQAHTGSYVAPLPWGHTFTLFGGYVDTLGHPSGTNLTGKSWQTSGRYGIDLPTFGLYTQKLNGGFDYKESNNNLEFGGQSVFNTSTQVSQLVLTYDGGLADPYGRTDLGLAFYGSPGGLGTHNRTGDYQVARSGAHADYVYGQVNLSRITRLPADFSWIVRGQYQAASTNLLGSEQFGLGGSDVGRGYREREANGDTGWYVSNELRTPPVSLSALFAPKVGQNVANDQLQFLAFWDYGWVRNVHLLSGEDPNVILSSVGPGVRYSISQYVTFKMDYGFQLTDPGLGDPDSGRGHIALTISY